MILVSTTPGGLTVDLVTEPTGITITVVGELDFITDAVEVAKAVGVPVKVMWTREDDLTHGFYRPSTYNVFRASLDAQGAPTAWFTRVVGPGILAWKSPTAR